MRKIGLVTGATAGIGKATARILAENGYDIIITGRRTEKLLLLEKEIRESTPADILTLCFDVRNRDEVSEKLGNLSGKWEAVDLLVNNAGLASGFSPMHEGSVEDWEKMIDTNVKGLLYVSREITPGMVKRNKGHVINISSIAAKEVYENGNVYCGTKHAVDAINKAMRMELVDYNIKVTSINPGAAETEFSIVRFGDEERAKQVYEGFTPLYADDVAEAVLFAVTRPPHVNINELMILATAQANSIKTVRKISKKDN